jgi:para-aminobenzoate synthetase/4-amino-4-deoxychorismate lyase
VPDAAPSDSPIAARVLLRDARSGGWLRLAEPRELIVARTLDAVVPAIAAAERLACHHGLHVAGFVTYEAAPALDASLDTRSPGWLPLAWFGAFAAAIPVAPPATRDLPATPDWVPSIDAHAYRRALDEIHRLIGAGDTYQVNFTYRLRATLDASWTRDLELPFAALVDRQPDALGALIETDRWAILCASHELFFDRDGRHITSRPMKGTAARGADREEDRSRAAWLAASVKNRAENLMITDMVRNDLGRVAAIGSVHTTALFELERYPTLWQMTSTVEADTDADLTGTLRALFPAASITGAPKRRAMQIIRDLEAGPRQIYTGTIGYLRPDGSAQFNVAIRTVLVDKSTATAEYGVGGGIVWDSDPDEEYAESRTKTLILNNRIPDFRLLETLRWTPAEGYLRLEPHLQRLAEAADYFGYPFDRARVLQAMTTAARSFPVTPRRIRLLLDRNGRPTIEDAELKPLPTEYRVALAPAPLPVEHDPFVRHKTTHRDIYERARLQVSGVDDVLLWNTRGELTESTIANLLMELDGEWVTPPVTSGLLAGVGRRELLASGHVRERVVLASDLSRCTGLALVNDLRGRWPVRLVAAAD